MIRGILLLSFVGTVGLAQPYVAWTVAGGGQPFTPIAAVSASIGQPGPVAADAGGNIYFSSAQCVLKVDPKGILTLVAGDGRAGSTQDGVPAAAAHVSGTSAIAVDSAGNLYIADATNRIRKVSPNGIITTVAGDGTIGDSGDGGPATSAQFSGIYSLAADGAGNLYVSDSGRHVVRRISPNGIITTVAGGGISSAEGVPATSAQLNSSRSLATDTAGNLYIADPFLSRVRKVSTSGIITTVAGNGVNGFSGDGGPATAAALSQPSSVAVDAAGEIYIGELDLRVRKVSPAGIITTVAGTGVRGYSGDGGPAIAASLTSTSQIAVDAAGNLYIADYAANRVRKVSPAGIVTTIAGNGIRSFSGDGGPAVLAQLDAADIAAVDAAGSLYIADAANNRVRKVSIQGTITTIAGNGTSGFSGDGGPAVDAQFFFFTLASESNGPLHYEGGLAIDAAGNLYIADSGNRRVRKVATNGTVTTFAGGGTGGDGVQATDAALESATAVACDNAGNVYIVDSASIRKVSPSGIITTVAGTGNSGHSGDGGPATRAQLDGPTAVVVDAAGNLYIAEGTRTVISMPPFGFSLVSGQSRIRKVSANGIITTVAGVGDPGYSGDGGPATSARLNDPAGVAVDAAGNLYIADTGNLRLRVVSPAGIITTAFGGPSPDPNAQLYGAGGVAIDTAGNIYVADNDAVLRVQPAGRLPSLNAIANAASELPGPVAPREIVVLRGSALGPTQLTVFTPDNSGGLPVQLAGTRVFFNGVAAPIIYAWDPQVAAEVPDGVGGGPLLVVVEYQGVQSAPLQVQTVPTAPGMFTADTGGTGQAAALNADGTGNSASTPATAGSIVSMFTTGEGLTVPGDVRANIDGQSAEIVHAGAAAGFVAGVMRVDARIPTGTHTGNVAVTVTTGTSQTQSGVTIAVSGKQ